VLKNLLTTLQKTLGDNVRIQPVPCVGRCQEAPVTVVGQNPIATATVEKTMAAIDTNQTNAPIANYINREQYEQEGGYQTLQSASMVNVTPNISLPSWKILAYAV